jgi:hypothetical protein
MGLEVLSGFMGGAGGGAGGGAQKGSSDQLSSTSGDAKSNSTFDFSGMNNAFTLGGRGSTSASAANDKSTGSTNNTPLYIALSIAGFAVFGVFVWSAMHKA